MGTVGPSFIVNEAALELLATFGDDVPIERLTELGVHYGIEGALRFDGISTVQKATVYEWLTRGIPGPGPCPRGPEGPPGFAGGIPGPDYGGNNAGPSKKDAHAMPWYVAHVMRQTRRQNRVN